MNGDSDALAWLRSVSAGGPVKLSDLQNVYAKTKLGGSFDEIARRAGGAIGETSGADVRRRTIGQVVTADDDVEGLVRNLSKSK